MNWLLVVEKTSGEPITDGGCVVGNPSSILFLALLGNCGNRSLVAPLAHVESSTHLGPRKPVAPQRSHPKKRIVR